MSDTNIKVEPCPFCLRSNLILDLKENNNVAIKCVSCSATGPIFPTVFDAVRSWNRKDDSPTLAEDFKPNIKTVHARQDLVTGGK